MDIRILFFISFDIKTGLVSNDVESINPPVIIDMFTTVIRHKILLIM